MLCRSDGSSSEGTSSVARTCTRRRQLGPKNRPLTTTCGTLLLTLYPPTHTQHTNNKLIFKRGKISVENIGSNCHSRFARIPSQARTIKFPDCRSIFYERNGEGMGLHQTHSSHLRCSLLSDPMTPNAHATSAGSTCFPV